MSTHNIIMHHNKSFTNRNKFFGFGYLLLYIPVNNFSVVQIRMISWPVKPVLGSEEISVFAQAILTHCLG